MAAPDAVRRPWSTSSLPRVAWAAGGCVVRRCGSSASGGKSGWRSRKVVLLRAVILGRAGDEVARSVDRWRPFGAAPWRIDFFIVRASRVCSSHSGHGVFSPILVGGRRVSASVSSVVSSMWVLFGLAPFVLVLLYGF